MLFANFITHTLSLMPDSCSLYLKGISVCLFVLLSFWLYSNVCNVMGTSKLLLCSYSRQPAWWRGPTLVPASRTSPAEKPARHSEPAAPSPASPMTSAACKTPGWGAKGHEESGQRENVRRRERRSIIFHRGQLKKNLLNSHKPVRWCISSWLFNQLFIFAALTL